MDNLLLLTLLLVFLTALVGVYIRRRSHDRVLKGFDTYRVTVELNNDQKVQGTLAVYSSGLEMRYAYPQAAVETQLQPTKTSYIVFQPQFTEVQAICRYHDELTAEGQKRRRQEVERTYNPGFRRRMGRHLQNFLNTFRDAVRESLGILMVRLRENTQSQVLSQEGGRFQRMGEEALGAVGTAYDPILERYIGHRVVVERKKEELAEVGGILKEYSPDWLSLLACRLVQQSVFNLGDTARLRLQSSLDFGLFLEKKPDKGMVFTLEITNHNSQPVSVKRLEAPEYMHTVDQQLAFQETAVVTVSDLPAAVFRHIPEDRLPAQWSFVAPERAPAAGVSADDLWQLPQLQVVLGMVREVDLCLPRSQSVVRYGGEVIN